MRNKYRDPDRIPHSDFMNAYISSFALQRKVGAAAAFSQGVGGPSRATIYRHMSGGFPIPEWLDLANMEKQLVIMKGIVEELMKLNNLGEDIEIKDIPMTVSFDATPASGRISVYNFSSDYTFMSGYNHSLSEKIVLHPLNKNPRRHYIQ